MSNHDIAETLLAGRKRMANSIRKRWSGQFEPPAPEDMRGAKYILAEMKNQWLDGGEWIWSNQAPKELRK